MVTDSNITLTPNGSTFLNLLRVLASQLVLVGHLISWLKIFHYLEPPYLPYMQGVSVVIFFILSGIIISYSTAEKINKHLNYTFKEFVIDRFARIYTVLIPALILVVILDLISIAINKSNYVYFDNFNIKTFIANVLMLEENPLNKFSTIISFESFGTNRPLWTLAIEWWIYFWFGFLYIVIIKQSKVTVLNVIILVLFSIVPFYNFGQGLGDGLMLPWLLGCLITIVLPVINRLKINKYLIFLILIFCSISIFKRYREVRFSYNESIYVLYLSIMVTLLISFFNGINFNEKIRKSINVFAGFSFTLYLIHYSVISLLIVLFKDKVNPYLFFCFAFIGSNIVAYYFASITEMKYKLVRDFLKKKFKIVNS